MRAGWVDEDGARKAVPTVLAAPGIADIRIANENVIAGPGIDAVDRRRELNSALTWSYSKSMASASSAAGGDCRPEP